MNQSSEKGNEAIENQQHCYEAKKKRKPSEVSIDEWTEQTTRNDRSNAIHRV